MYYAEFYHLSTGYIPHSIPPKFDDSWRKPIPVCGSNGLFILDGRNSLQTMIADAKERMKKVGDDVIGFKIIRAKSLLSTGIELYSNIK